MSMKAEAKLYFSERFQPHLNHKIHELYFLAKYARGYYPGYESFYDSYGKLRKGNGEFTIEGGHKSTRYYDRYFNSNLYPFLKKMWSNPKSMDSVSYQKCMDDIERGGPEHWFDSEDKSNREAA